MGGEKSVSLQFQYKGKEEESAGTLAAESPEDEEWERAERRRGRITLSSPKTISAAAVRFFWILFGFALRMWPAVIPKRVIKSHPDTPLL